jgi:hypothetical protein
VQEETSTPGALAPKFRTTARVVGVLLIAAFFAYGGGNAVLASVLAAPDPLASIGADAMTLRLGAMLMLLNSVFVAAIGVLLLRVARPHSEGIAFGYLTARIVEAVFLAVGIVFLLLQVPLGRESLDADPAAAALLQSLSTVSLRGNDFAYAIAMFALGLASVPFWLLMYRVQMVPRVLAVWGVAGYAIFMAGMVLELSGIAGVGLMLSLPGGLFEIAVGLWLIARGFRSPTTVAGDLRAAELHLQRAD